MTWNDFTPPAGWLTVTSANLGHMFFPGDALTFTLSGSTATGYTVRNYHGDVVESGSVSGTTLTLTSNLPQGWYRLYLNQAGSDTNYGSLIGVASFSIIGHDSRLSDPPAWGPLPWGTPTGNDPGYSQSDNILTGVALLGPRRQSIKYAAAPTGSQDGVGTENIAMAQAELAYMQSWYLAKPDSVRPRPLFVAFPNGTDDIGQPAGVTAVVSALYPNYEWFEGPYNEPPTTEDPVAIAGKMQVFHDAVKAGNPNAKVLGPCLVSVNGATLDWFSRFLDAGGGAYLDGVSYHTYNTINGDITLGRKGLDAFVALLAAHGLSGLPRWQTEWGQFATSWGVLDPKMQARWAMMNRFVLEQYGVPKEHEHYYYDTSHGYWSYPSMWKMTDGSVMPMWTMMRVYSQELFGKAWASSLDFGTVENAHFIGSRFAAPDGSAVLTFLSGGRTDGSVKLRVTGATSLTLVDAFGNTSTVTTDARHMVTVPVTVEPCYLRLPIGVTATVQQVGYGINMTTWGTFAEPQLVNHDLENSFFQGGAVTEWRDTRALPTTVEVQLRRTRRFDTVVVHCPTPWQQQGTLLDYDLEYQSDDLAWHHLDTVTEPSTTVHAPAPPASGYCFYDSYHSGRCVFVHTFAPVVGRGVRLVVRDATSGGVADVDASTVGGFAGDRKIRIREIEVYCRDTATRRTVMAA